MNNQKVEKKKNKTKMFSAKFQVVKLIRWPKISATTATTTTPAKSKQLRNQIIINNFSVRHFLMARAQSAAATRKTVGSAENARKKIENAISTECSESSESICC